MSSARPMTAAPAAASAPTALVARQPIFDRDKQVHAYELLYRAAGQEHADFRDGEHATATVLISSFLDIGLERLVERHAAFVNVTRAFLLSGAALALPREQVVLEILEDVEVDEALVAAVRELAEQGYRIALDDFSFDPRWHELLRIAHVVKVDVMALGLDQTRRHVELLSRYDVQLLAEKVESAAEYEALLAMGFRYFQGYFFAKPNIVSGARIPENKLAVLRLLVALQDPEADVDVGAIHARGVVHRDLKPENVLITADHVVKVMDLGVARLADEQLRLSQSGAFVGSAQYAAPEQFGGEVDHRCDLHALGLVLYELACGQHPYRADDFRSVMRKVCEESPRRAGDINPQLSAFLEEVVHTLLAKSRDDRFQDAATLLGVLEEGEDSAWWHERAAALQLATKRPLRRIRIPRETAVYGREKEIARLTGLYEKAKAGDGQVVLIEGEAGIGKSRLVDELIARLHASGEDLNFLFGSYPPGGAATAAGGFSSAYREHFGEAGCGDFLLQVPLLAPAFDAVLRGEPSPTGVVELTKDSLGTCFVHATRSLAAERVTVVLIDDLHFAPAEARTLFMAISQAVPGHRVLLVGTMRPGVSVDWVANVTRLDHATRVEVPRLGTKDLADLLGDSFKSKELAHSLGMQIGIKSDGNPFFAFEIIRGLREGQFITQKDDGTWVSTSVIDEIQIPSSVLDLVNARVADLTEDERALLDVAACWGFEFDAGLVGEVLGLPRIPALRSFGQIERRHRLVRSSGRNYVFDHHQVQEALYGSINEQLREEYHSALATALESRTKSVDKDPATLDGALCVDLCEQFLKGAQGARALRYLEAAQAHLRKGYLNDQAVALAERALSAPGLLEGAQRAKVLLQVDAHLDLLGRRKAQEAALDEAAALAEDGGEQALRADVARARGHLLHSTGREEEARAQYELALSIFREIGDRSGEATATNGLGNVLDWLGRFEEARVQYERARSIFREIGDRGGEAGATMNLGNVFKHLGRYEEDRALQERALSVFREVGKRSAEANATMNLGTALKCLGRDEEAMAYQERALAIFREIGHRVGEANAMITLGIGFRALGRLEEARAHQERAQSICREVGNPRGEAVALVNLGPLWAGLGEWGRAREALERSLSICQAIGAPYPEGYALISLASVADEEGQVEEARRLARQSLDLRRAIGHGDGVAESLCFLGDLERREGNTEEARDLLEESLSVAREHGMKAEVALALALLARLPGGDASAAEEALEEASDTWKTTEVRFHLFQATGEREHLAEAKRLLDERVHEVPEDRRASMLQNVRLNREIIEAWPEHQGYVDTRVTKSGLS